MIATALAVAAIGAAAATAVGPTLFPDRKQETFWGGIALMIAGLLCALIAYLSAPKRAASADSIPPVIQNDVSSIGQSGGIAAGAVNIGRQDRNLDAAAITKLKAMTLSRLPEGGRIDVTALIGDPEAHRYAQQIFRFLEANGYNVGGFDIVGHELFIGVRGSSTPPVASRSIWVPLRHLNRTASREPQAARLGICVLPAIEYLQALTGETP